MSANIQPSRIKAGLMTLSGTTSDGSTNTFKIVNLAGSTVAYINSRGDMYGRMIATTLNILSKTIITSSGTTALTTGSTQLILVSGTSVTITLPSIPISGQAFRIKDACGNAAGSNITVDSGVSMTIDGARCAVISTNYGALELVYGAANKWFNLSRFC